MAKDNFNCNRPGETALQKAVRLLDRLNQRIADPDVPGMRNIEIRLRRDGEGELIAEGEEPGMDRSLYYFTSPDGLMKFLEAPLAAQIQTINDK